jgi:hypothetical protein
MSKAAIMPSAVANAPALDCALRDYLETNADIVTHIKKPVSIDDVGALSAQSGTPIVFENIIEKPGFRLCDILVALTVGLGFLRTPKAWARPRERITIDLPNATRPLPRTWD